MEKNNLWTKDYIYICISCFFLFITFYSCMAVLPLFVISGLKSNQQLAGLAMTMFLIGSVIFRPFAGKWVDELGRKKMIFISLSLYLILSILYLIVANLSALLVLRFIHGAAFSLANTSLYAVVADLVPEKRKGEGLGYFATFMSLAMVIGPFLGLTIIDGGNYKLFFILCAICSVLSLLCGNITHIPKVMPKEKSNMKESFDITKFFETKVVPVSFAAALTSFAYSSISTFVSVYAKQIGMGKIAGYFFICYAVMLIICRPFVGKIYDSIGPNYVIYPSFFILAIGIVALAMANTPFVFLMSGGLIGIGNGTLFSSMQTRAITLCDEKRRGVATSTYFLFYDSGMGIGAFIHGIIVAQTSYSFMYIVASGIVIASAISYYGVRGNNVDYANNKSIEEAL